jgi:hypothetical protein
MTRLRASAAWRRGNSGSRRRAMTGRLTRLSDRLRPWLELALRIDDLRNAMSRALAAKEQLLGPEGGPRDSYFWYLPVDAAFDITRGPIR